jgi:DHA1 family tetracycline resistance protein-like MFS transporter
MQPTMRSLAPVYMVIFIGFVGYSLMITVFTPMIMYAHNGMIAPDSSTGQRTVLLGILLFLYPFGQFFGAPVLGALSDRFGRKPVLLTSLCITACTYGVIATALASHSVPLLLVSCLVAGLSEANVVIAQGAIADVTSRAERSRFFGYVYLSSSLAFIIGPLVGGKLADPGLVRWFDYATPFWTVFGLLIVTALWVLLTFGETRAPRPGTMIRYLDALTSLKHVVTDRRIRLLYGINFLLYLAIFGFFRSNSMYLVDEFHMDVSRLSEFIAWISVPIIIANLWVTGFLARRFPPAVVTFWSALLLGPFMVLVVIPDQPDALWVTLFLASFALAVCLPASATMLSVAVGEEEQGRVMGNNQSLQVGAEAFSGLAAGFLAAILVSLPMLVLALAAVLAALVLALSGTLHRPAGPHPVASD